MPQLFKKIAGNDDAPDSATLKKNDLYDGVLFTRRRLYRFVYASADTRTEVGLGSHHFQCQLYRAPPLFSVGPSPGRRGKRAPRRLKTHRCTTPVLLLEQALYGDVFFPKIRASPAPFFVLFCI